MRQHDIIPNSQELMQDEALRASIQAHLQASETVMWLGKPHQALYDKWKKAKTIRNRVSVPFLGLAYIFVLLLVFIYHDFDVNASSIQAFLIISVLAIPYIFHKLRPIKNLDDTLYVLTNLRLIALPHGRSMTSVIAIDDDDDGAHPNHPIKCETSLTIQKTKSQNGVQYHLSLVEVNCKRHNASSRKGMTLYFVRTEGLEEALVQHKTILSPDEAKKRERITPAPSPEAATSAEEESSETMVDKVIGPVLIWVLLIIPVGALATAFIAIPVSIVLMILTLFASLFIDLDLEALNKDSSLVIIPLSISALIVGWYGIKNWQKTAQKGSKKKGRKAWKKGRKAWKPRPR